MARVVKFVGWMSVAWVWSMRRKRPGSMMRKCLSVTPMMRQEALGGESGREMMGRWLAGGVGVRACLRFPDEVWVLHAAVNDEDVHQDEMSRSPLSAAFGESGDELANEYSCGGGKQESVDDCNEMVRGCAQVMNEEEEGAIYRNGRDPEPQSDSA